MVDENTGASFFEHLSELRTVFFKLLICIAILFPLCYAYSTPVLEYFIKSCSSDGLELKYFSPMEPFFVEMKLSLVMAVFIGIPYIAYQVWSFIAPGLYSKERYAISRFSFFSWFFFLLGAFFSLKFIFPLVIKFSMGFESDYIKANIGIQNFMGMATMMTVGFGLMFQFPIAVFLLVKTGMVDVATMRKSRPVVIIGILVLSALLTPPDVVSQLMMGLPTYILFEGSLFFAQFTRVKELERRDDEDDESETDVETVEQDHDIVVKNDEAVLPEPVIDDSYDFEDDFDDGLWGYDSEHTDAVSSEKRRKRKIRGIRNHR